ncbi:hypothetical protein JQ615_28120 [Bradyrhizobium jicamae]|uniref:Secreted protein n=1 Tax=Bradyrhizobium jicamae TaxID=280332 RepID=A0ABS5FR24_9BRAD|nr:hypothetical protein [Bradyrhizobium jicamae]MBR0799263.1 hypothetical protein [Bradyrhizobium jicamae]
MSHNANHKSAVVLAFAGTTAAGAVNPPPSKVTHPVNVLETILGHQ